MCNDMNCARAQLSTSLLHLHNSVFKFCSHELTVRQPVNEIFIVFLLVFFMGGGGEKICKVLAKICQDLTKNCKLQLAKICEDLAKTCKDLAKNFKDLAKISEDRLKDLWGPSRILSTDL